VLPTPVVVERVGQSVVVRDSSGRRIEGADGVQLVGVGSALLTVDGVDAPGTVWFHAAEGGGIDAVEHVAMEAYLPGVLEKELPGGWNDAAYEAQAIAARSFALHERQRKIRMGSHFDVESTTVSQVYGGAVVESWSHNAVRRTSGLVLKHDGELVRAYFSSTSGGRSASAMDIWGVGGDGRLAFNASPALQASDVAERLRPDGRGWDSGSPRYRWSAERMIGPLSDRIRAYGSERGFSIGRMGRLVSINVSEQNAAGRPVEFEVVDDAGKTWRMPAEHMRWAMGAGEDVGGGSVWSSDFEARVEGNRVLITGRGWGHGVGLCQWSAKGMGEAGWDADRILSVFYPGTEKTRAW
jgi:stage II sporulation protein D